MTIEEATFQPTAARAELPTPAEADAEIIVIEPSKGRGSSTSRSPGATGAGGAVEFERGHPLCGLPRSGAITRMEGIQFVVDETGKKRAVQIDLAVWGELWEDFYDLALSQSRRSEPTVAWSTLKERLAPAPVAGD